MVGYIWSSLIVIGIIFSLFTGNLDVINESILQNGSEALELMLSIFPLIIIWTGIMKISEDSGLLKIFSNFFSPILNKLFPKIPKDNPALGYIASNVAANMLGLGSAATPFGLKAMDELQKINPKKDTATSSMITFLVLNTGGVTIIPTTVIALRVAAGSNNAMEIIIPAIIATLLSNISGLVLDYFIRRKNHE